MIVMAPYNGETTTMNSPKPTTSMLLVAADALRSLKADSTRTADSDIVWDPGIPIVIHRARVDMLLAPGGPVERFNALADKAGIDRVVVDHSTSNHVHLHTVACMVDVTISAATSPSGMLTLAAGAMRDLNADSTATLGNYTVWNLPTPLAVHRARVEALLAPGGPVERFNALADKVGTTPVVVNNAMWDCLHLDLVAQMVTGAIAASA